MQPHFRPLISVLAFAALFASPGVASAQTGQFSAGEPWFVGPLGQSGVQRDINGTDIHVDTPADPDGLPNPGMTFELPSAIRHDPTVSLLEDRLSPAQDVLYTRKVHTSCPNGQVYFHKLETPPNMTLLATECLPAGIAIQPLFFDAPGSSIRTAVLVTETIPATTFRQAVLWVDLVNGTHNLDPGTYEANVLFPIEFAPGGNAALVRHGGGTQYTLIDLCQSRVAGAGSHSTFGPPELPLPGVVTAHVVTTSTGSLFAELQVNSTPVPGVGISLDNCLALPSVFLEIAKSAPFGISSGSQFDYTLTVRNTGINLATNVVVEDTVPAGTTFISASAGGSEQNDVVRWDLGTVGSAAEVITFTVRPTCLTVTQIRNDNYTVSSSQTAARSGPPVLTGCFPLPPVRLSITKSAGATTVRQGELLTYTLRYDNTGTGTATGVIVEDTLPAGTAFVSASPAATVAGRLVTWNIPNVPPNGNASVTVTVRAGCLPEITNNQYSIRSSTTSPVTGPQVVTPVTAASTAPVEVTVTSTPITRSPPLLPGDLVQHVITLTNTAAEPRHGLHLDILAGRGSRFDQVIDAGGGAVSTPNPTRLIWTGDLAALATVTIVFTTRVEDCLTSADVSTTLNDGRPIQVIDTCNRVLGTQAAITPISLLPPVVATLRVVGLGDPQPNINNELVQAARAGGEIDLQIAIVNQSPSPEPAVSFSVVLPSELTLVATPPFVPPTHAAAAYDDVTRTVSWSGAIDAGETVLVTFRVRVPHSGVCSSRLALSGSRGACQNLGTTLRILAVPEVPVEPHIVGTDNRDGLWMLRPGVDTAFANLLCFQGETYSGMTRAANGDLWIAGLPSYRLNPSTLELQVLGPSAIRPPGSRLPNDVAVNRTAANALPIFLVPDAARLSQLMQFDPVTGQATLLRGGLPGMQRIVMAGSGRIAGVIGPNPTIGAPGGVILLDPVDPANDRVLNDPAFPSLDLNLLDVDADGRLIVAVPADPLVFGGTQHLLRIDPGTAGPGTFSLLASDLAALIPPPLFSIPAFRSVATGAGEEVYLGRVSAGSLGLLNTTPPPMGATLAIGRNVVDLEFVDPSAPPPAPSPLTIEVNETVLVADVVDLLPGVVLVIDEQVAIGDAVDLLPGVVLRIDEHVAVIDEIEVIPDNTPPGTDVLVALTDPATGRILVIARFTRVTRSGISSFTSRIDGPPPPPGYRAGEPPIVYDVTTTALFDGPAVVCLDASMQRFANPPPRIFHFEGTSWVDRTLSIDATTQTVCASVAALSPFALFTAADATPPVTTIAASPGPNQAGWNRTDVTLVLSAADGPGGSGVRRVHATLTGAQTGTLSDPPTPIVVSAEGITTVTYFAEDHAGNVEAAKVLVVRIDRTPPELEAHFDPDTHDIAAFGIDALSGVPAGPIDPSVTAWRPTVWHSDTEWDVSHLEGRHVELRRYEVEDLAGNRVELSMLVLPDRQPRRGFGSHELLAFVRSVQYDDNPAHLAPPNKLMFTWTFDRHADLKRLVQEMTATTARRRRTVNATFDPSRDVTAIRDGRKRPVERPGLVLLRLVTTRGTLSIQY